MIKIDKSKKLTKLSTKNCKFKKFCTVWNVLENVLFFFTNLFPGNFLYSLRPFIITKDLSSVCTPAKMKENLLHWFYLVKIFASFVKLLNISLDEYNLLLNHAKQAWTKKTILMLLSRMIIYKLSWETANIQLRKFRSK